MKNSEWVINLFPEAVGVASVMGLGLVGRMIDYQLHPEIINSLRQNWNLTDLFSAPYQSYTLLNETNPLLTRLLEIGLGVGIGRLKIVREYLVGN